MAVGKCIASLMGALLILLTLMAAVFYIIPLYQKIQLDEVCREYTYAVNVNEGMLETQELALEEELKAIGLKEILITCPKFGDLMRRQRQAFKVTGIIQYQGIRGFMDFGTEEGHYEFKGWVYGKRIVN